jgi:hypothetical protein
VEKKRITIKLHLRPPPPWKKEGKKPMGTSTPLPINSGKIKEKKSSCTSTPPSLSTIFF